MRVAAAVVLFALCAAAPVRAQEATAADSQSLAMLERAIERFKLRVEANPELTDARELMEWGDLDLDEMLAGFQGSSIPDSTLLHTLDLVQRSLPDASVEMCEMMALMDADSTDEAATAELGRWALARADSALVEEWLVLAEEWMVVVARGLDRPWVEPEPIDESAVTTLFLRILAGLTPEEQQLFGQAISEAAGSGGEPDGATSCAIGMMAFHAFFRLAPEEQLLLTRALITAVETYEAEEAPEALPTGVTGGPAERRS